MMKMKLKSRNFENLQRFSAFSRTSEQISLNSATNFENANVLAFITLRTPKTLTKLCWNIEVWAVQKHANLVDLVKSFPPNIYLQNLASIQPRTSLSKFVSFYHIYPAQRFNFHIGTTPHRTGWLCQNAAARGSSRFALWAFLPACR